MSEETQTTENTLQYAAVWQRMSAILIDLSVCFFAGGLVATLTNIGQFTPIMFAGAIVMTLLPFAYFITMHGRYGATLGKRIMRIKLVMEDGTRVNYSTAGTRMSPYLILYVVMVSNAGFTEETISSPVLDWVIIIWFVGSFAQAIVDPKHRAPHDMLAKTLVTKV